MPLPDRHFPSAQTLFVDLKHLIVSKLRAVIRIGVSRKSFLGELTGDPTEDRDLAGHVAGGIAIFAGADAVRVHDVAGARRVRAIAVALRDARRASP